jgi:tripartite-type tricarboxylate transporter receptor subunit TctC
MKHFLAHSFLIGLSAFSLNALAQGNSNFPDRSVRIIVPFGAGGATDIISRTVGQKLSEMWKQPVVVDNRSGANGNIGASDAAKSAPDGYTLLMATSSHAINATLYKNLNYSLSQDFVALSNLAFVPLVLVVNPAIPANTVKELATYAKANSGTLNFGSGGVGTAAHLAGELFNTETGSKMLHVPYKGGALAMNDLLGGQIQVMFANLPEANNQIKANKLRALAVTGDQRNPQQPDVTTFAESGFPSIDLKSWFGLFVPKGTPTAVVQKLSTDISAAVQDPAVQKRLTEIGSEPVGSKTEQFQPFVNNEIKRWGGLITQSGATAQ